MIKKEKVKLQEKSRQKAKKRFKAWIRKGEKEEKVVHKEEGQKEENKNEN